MYQLPCWLFFPPQLSRFIADYQLGWLFHLPSLFAWILVPKRSGVLYTLLCWHMECYCPCRVIGCLH